MADPVILLAMSPSRIQQFFPSPWGERLASLGHVIATPTPGDHFSAGAREALRRADVIVTSWGTPMIDADVLDLAPRLKAVVHTTGSVRTVASADCYQRGVLISSQAGAMAGPVAQYTVAMILLAGKGAFRARRIYHELRTGLDVQVELADYGGYQTRVGIIGASVIGRRVIELLRPYDLPVVLADPTVDPGEAARLDVTLVTLPELMSTCRVVSLHAPVLPTTIGMIDSKMISLLPDGATFINTARGSLVDQQALAMELCTGRIEAVLDVTDPEVPDTHSPLWDLPNVFLTPHIAGPVGRELGLLAESTIAELKRLLTGRQMLNLVPERRYHLLA